MRYAVILAGGSGARLWPASRQAHPKQLLPLGRGNELLIADAVALGRQIAERVMIVTAEALRNATQHALPDVEVITEPVGRNTAAAIGLAGALITKRDPEAVITILPADHHVRDIDELVAALNACHDAAKGADAIALIGIPPTRPETGYGYLEMEGPAFQRASAVVRFIEKPNLANASLFATSGKHLWNAGIFCMTAKRLQAELESHLPATAAAVQKIADGDVLNSRAIYEDLPAISFDHAVMERTQNVVAVSAAVGWNDVGAWGALSDVRGTDADGNTLVGHVTVIDGRDNVMMSDDDTLIAAIGVSGLVVIKSRDAVLIVPRDQAQRVREIVERLSRNGLDRYL